MPDITHAIDCDMGEDCTCEPATAPVWTYVWMTPDGPGLGRLHATVEDAMNEAFAEWVEYEGGNLGGYDEGTRDEFDVMYAESSELWVAAISPSERT